ncbi:MAG: hypothetical protein V7750_11160 [Sneathiella sp.]
MSAPSSFKTYDIVLRTDTAGLLLPIAINMQVPKADITVMLCKGHTLADYTGDIAPAKTLRFLI